MPDETEARAHAGASRMCTCSRRPAATDQGETCFRLDLSPTPSGLQYYQIRMFPFHPALAHRYETGYMIWL